MTELYEQWIVNDYGNSHKWQTIGRPSYSVVTRNLHGYEKKHGIELPELNLDTMVEYAPLIIGGALGLTGILVGLFWTGRKRK